MNINTKTQLQKDLDSLQKGVNQVKNIVAHAIEVLNGTHSNMWQLPDDRLQSLLQHLQDEGHLQDMFDSHVSAAEDLNFLAENSDIPIRAFIGKKRELTVAEDGTVTLEPVTFPEPDSPEDVTE